MCERRIELQLQHELALEVISSRRVQRSGNPNLQLTPAFFAEEFCAIWGNGTLPNYSH